MFVARAAAGFTTIQIGVSNWLYADWMTRKARLSSGLVGIPKSAIRNYLPAVNLDDLICSFWIEVRFEIGIVLKYLFTYIATLKSRGILKSRPQLFNNYGHG